MRNLIKNFKSADTLASLAIGTSTLAANKACIYILHQPKLPDAVKKLRKF